MASLDGASGIGSCQLTSSKSVLIIEETLLDYLRQNLLTDEALKQIVALANAELDRQAQAPDTEDSKLRSRARRLRYQIERLVRQMSQDDDDGLAAALRPEIKRFSKELTSLQPELQAAEQRQRRSVSRLSLAQARLALGELREVLACRTPAAATAIRDLTGPVLISQEPAEEGPNRFRWLATFTPQWTSVLSQASPPEDRQLGPSMSSQLELKPVTLVVRHMPKYERMAAEFQRLRAAGATAQAIARELGVAAETVQQGLRFFETGERPQPKSSKKAGQKWAPRRPTPAAADAIPSHDGKRLRVPVTAKKSGGSKATVSPPDHQGRPEIAHSAIPKGTRIDASVRPTAS